MRPADDVREYCRATYVDPARRKGQKTIIIRSGDVHSSLTLQKQVSIGMFRNRLKSFRKDVWFEKDIG